MRRLPSGLILLSLLVGVSLVPLPAQRLPVVKADRLDLGLKLRMFKFAREAALRPIERQIKVAWYGKTTVKVRRESGKREMIEADLSVKAFWIDKKSEYRTGPSLQDQLNGANTLDDFLVRRGVDDPDERRLRAVSYKKPIKDRKKNVYQVARVIRRSRTTARVYYHETDAEIFGLLVESKTGVGPFVEGLDKIVKTIQRVPVVADENGADADPYAASDLPNIARRREVLATLPRSWRHLDTENFLVVTGIPKGSKNDKLVETIAQDLEIMRDCFEQRFKPVAPLKELAIVRIFNSYDAYRNYGAPKGTGGYWDPRRKELVLPNPGERVRNPLSYRKNQNAMHTLYHEAMHQYLHYANGVVSPMSWFDEGYGEYFGGAQLDRRRDAVKKIALNQTRWKMVGLQAKNNAYPPLKKLLTMDQAEFYGRFALSNYAFAWAFCYFLEGERKKGSAGNKTYAAIPDRYLENLRAAAKRHRTRKAIYDAAYQATFGDLDLARVEKDWLKAMKKWK